MAGEWHGNDMGAAWARPGMCELAFNVSVVTKLCTGCDTCRTISFKLTHIIGVSALARNVRWTYFFQTADHPDTHSVLSTPTTTSITSTSVPSIFSNLHSYFKILIIGLFGNVR
jgi:hypothetical protein